MLKRVMLAFAALFGTAVALAPGQASAMGGCGGYYTGGCIDSAPVYKPYVQPVPIYKPYVKPVPVYKPYVQPVPVYKPYIRPVPRDQPVPVYRPYPDYKPYPVYKPVPVYKPYPVYVPTPAHRSPCASACGAPSCSPCGDDW